MASRRNDSRKIIEKQDKSDNMELNEVNKWLLEVEHPAKGDKNIVELGMVEKVEVSQK